jgi:hypothetical protein
MGFWSAAQADTVVTYARDASQPCYNYCTAYTTDNSAVSMDFGNVRIASVYLPTSYSVTVHVNGISYSAVAYASQWAAGVPVYAIDGSYLTLTANWSSKTTCVRSGRGQHCTTWYFLNSGTLTYPYDLVTP